MKGRENRRRKELAMSNCLPMSRFLCKRNFSEGAPSAAQACYQHAMCISSVTIPDFLGPGLDIAKEGYNGVL